jgi:hypothetical protein
VGALCSSRSSRVRPRKSHRAVAAAQCGVVTSCAARAPFGRVRSGAACVSFPRHHRCACVEALVRSDAQVRVGDECLRPSARMRACERACVRACVRAYVRACMHECVRACAHACTSARVRWRRRRLRGHLPAATWRGRRTTWRPRSSAASSTASPARTPRTRALPHVPHVSATRTQAMYGMHRAPCYSQCSTPSQSDPPQAPHRGR